MPSPVHLLPLTGSAHRAVHGEHDFNRWKKIWVYPSVPVNSQPWTARCGDRYDPRLVSTFKNFPLQFNVQRQHSTLTRELLIAEQNTSNTDLLLPRLNSLQKLFQELVLSNSTFLSHHNTVILNIFIISHIDISSVLSKLHTDVSILLTTMDRLSLPTTPGLLTLFMPTVAIWVRLQKHPVPDRVKQSFVFVDIRAL